MGPQNRTSEEIINISTTIGHDQPELFDCKSKSVIIKINTVPQIYLIPIFFCGSGYRYRSIISVLYVWYQQRLFLDEECVNCGLVSIYYCQFVHHCGSATWKEMLKIETKKKKIHGWLSWKDEDTPALFRQNLRK
jgi:hypothetical protein